MRELPRRRFLKTTSSVVVSVLVLGCDDDEGDDDMGGDGADTFAMAAPADGPAEDDGEMGCDAGANATTISANHGHSVMIPVADIEGGAGGDYDITGSSSHAHSITLSADDMASLADGMTVTVTSTDGGGHTHMVTLSC